MFRLQICSHSFSNNHVFILLSQSHMLSASISKSHMHSAFLSKLMLNPFFSKSHVLSNLHMLSSIQMLMSSQNYTSSLSLCFLIINSLFSLKITLSFSRYTLLSGSKCYLMMSYVNKDIQHHEWHLSTQGQQNSRSGIWHPCEVNSQPGDYRSLSSGEMNPSPECCTPLSKAIFLNFWPDHTSCPANAIHMGWVTWTICAEIKKYNLNWLLPIPIPLLSCTCSHSPCTHFVLSAFTPKKQQIWRRNQTWMLCTATLSELIATLTGRMIRKTRLREEIVERWS